MPIHFFFIFHHLYPLPPSFPPPHSLPSLPCPFPPSPPYLMDALLGHRSGVHFKRDVDAGVE